MVGTHRQTTSWMRSACELTAEGRAMTACEILYAVPNIRIQISFFRDQHHRPSPFQTQIKRAHVPHHRAPTPTCLGWLSARIVRPPRLLLLQVCCVHTHARLGCASAPERRHAAVTLTRRRPRPWPTRPARWARRCRRSLCTSGRPAWHAATWRHTRSGTRGRRRAS